MTERNLQYFDWEYERVDTIGILEFAAHENQTLLEMSVPVKAYQVVAHGDTPEEVVELIEFKNFRSSYEKFRLKIFRSKKWLSWQTGVGGVFFKDNEPRFFVPMIDMELVSTPDLKADMNKLSSGLNLMDCEGSLVRSGDVGFGGYFFVGHSILEYKPHYWQFLGKALSSFSNPNNENGKRAIEFGKQLQKAQTKNESLVIADLILNSFPSIQTGQDRDGMNCDARWIGHKLKSGYTILRQTPGKNYADKPLQIAGYY